MDITEEIENEARMLQALSNAIKNVQKKSLKNIKIYK